MITCRIVCFAFLAFLLPSEVMAIEEPEYQVIDSNADFELRRYSPYIVAEVDVTGDRDEAGRTAFRILAGYIFGENVAAEEMAMTAPVQSTPAARGEKMAMTAPVTATADHEGGQTTYAFVMERKYTLDSLPLPKDERIRIRKIPEKTMAVRRYTGRWTEKNYRKHEKSLLTALDELGIRALAEPVLARYNSPFSLPLMRRNEVMVEVQHAGQ